MLPVEVWLIKPASAPLSQDIKRHLQAETALRGRTLQTRIYETGRLAGGRPTGSLIPRDATALYKRAHRTGLGVLFVGTPTVDLEPSSPGPGRTISLERFLRYKALVRPLVTDDALSAVDQFLSDLDEWVSLTDCDGERDPRCLPLHVFDRSRDWRTLAGSAGRADFNATYGTGVRQGPLALLWQRARDRHGLEVLTVAGRALIAGFHWDVQNPKPAPRRVLTTNEIIEIRPNGYLNVHPDAHVGLRKGSARRIWAAPP